MKTPHVRMERLDQALLATLQTRFETHGSRHPDITWSGVSERLQTTPAAWPVLQAMEASGGEPDVVDLGASAAAGAATVVFCDCSAETPGGRRSLSYDDAGLAARKAHRPAGSAVSMAAAMGIELLDEAQYRALQALGPFDQKTSSWLRTPAAVRALGGALFGDHRYGRVFVYHNGAQSYYAVRGFRGLLRI